MSEFCKFCGEPLTDGHKHEFKKMCLNCEWLKTNDNGEQVCRNETNMHNALEKMYETLRSINGYNVTKIEVEPVPLKKPTNKCGQWELSKEVLEELVNLFV